MYLWIDIDFLNTFSMVAYFYIEMNFEAMPSERCRMLLTADGISSFQERRERLDCKEELEFTEHKISLVKM